MQTSELRFVFNTRTSPTLGSNRIYFQHVRRALDPMVGCAVYNDWDHYEHYDVAIFNSTDGESQRARQLNPRLVIGIAKLGHTRNSFEEMRRADFLIADSRFQRDLYLSVRRPILVLRLVEAWSKGAQHIPYAGPFTKERPALIGYHGNLVHLEQMGGVIGRALEAVARDTPLRLRAIYDIASLGHWSDGRPAIEIEDIQWELETLDAQLAMCDVGIVPNLVLPRRPGLWDWLKRQRWLTGGWYGDLVDDVLMRMKSSSNAGRAFLFMQVGVPVIACPVPECVEVLEPERRGLTAVTEAGWRDALMMLLENQEERTAMGQRAYQWALESLQPEIEAQKLLNFLLMHFGKRFV